MIKNYFKIAWRSILKNKLSSTINIIGLTLGFTSCLILLLFVDYESSFDQHHSRSEDIYRIVQTQEYPDGAMHFNATPYPLADALRSDLPEFEKVTQIVGLTTQIFEIEDNSGKNVFFEEPDVLFVDSFYPKVFDGVDWLAGNKENALENSQSIVLTKSLAQNLFGLNDGDYSSAIGKLIGLNGQDPIVVNGIVSDPKGNSNYRFRALIPYEYYRKNNAQMVDDWSVVHQGTTFVVLKDGVKKESIESKMNLWSKKYLNDKDQKTVHYSLQPLEEVHTNALYGSEPGGYIMPKKVLNIALIVAFFILLIAIVNFINLVTAQSVLRSKEVEIRKVMGSDHLGLTLRFLIENGLMISISILIAVLATYISLDYLNANLLIFGFDLGLRWKHAFLILAIACGTILLSTIYPAFVLSKFNPIKALKNNFSHDQSNGRVMRRSLIVFQFVIVQFLVAAVVVTSLQMRYFKTKDVGFTTSDQVVIVPMPDSKKKDIFKHTILQDTAIDEIAFGSGPPMGIDGLSLGTSFHLPSDDKSDAIYSEIKIGDSNYLEFYGLELIAGRNFEVAKDKFDQFVVNETLLKTYNWKPNEAIGKRLVINEGEATIVGVVRDYHNNALQYNITPSIIVNWNFLQNSAFVKIKNSHESTLAAIESAWMESFGDSVYSYSFLDDAIAREYATEQLVFKGFSVLAVLAICLGALGLLGLMSFVLLKKSKEIAIRKVLGSKPIEIVKLLSKEYIGLILLSFAIATPIAYTSLASWLENFTYRIDMAIWMFLLGGLLTLIISIAACSFQAIKAAVSNPVKSLRTE